MFPSKQKSLMTFEIEQESFEDNVSSVNGFTPKGIRLSTKNFAVHNANQYFENGLK